MLPTFNHEKLIAHFESKIQDDEVIEHLINQGNKFEFWLQYETIKYLLQENVGKTIEVEKRILNSEESKVDKSGYADIIVDRASDRPIFVEFKVMMKIPGKSFTSDANGFFDDILKLKQAGNNERLAILVACGHNREMNDQVSYSDYMESRIKALQKKEEYKNKISFETGKEVILKKSKKGHKIQIFFQHEPKLT